jgi:predicted Zn-dependent peptidase
MYLDDPASYISDLMSKVLYGDQALGRSTLGDDKATIISFSQNNFLEFKNCLYVPKNIVIATAGKIDENKVIEKIKAYFTDMPARDKKQFEPVIEKQKKPQSLVFYKKTDQAHLMLGFRAYSIFHPDRHVLNVIEVLLGRSMSSRLFIEVRERRGWAYYIGTSYWEFADTGALCTGTGLKLDKIEEAISVILSEHNKLKNELVSSEELEKVKNYIKGRIALSFEDSMATAGFFGEQELSKNKIETYEEICEKINKVTAEDIQRVANDIFRNEKLNMAIIGPFKDKKRFDKLLKI